MAFVVVVVVVVFFYISPKRLTCTSFKTTCGGYGVGQNSTIPHSNSKTSGRCNSWRDCNLVPRVLSIPALRTDRRLRQKTLKNSGYPQFNPKLQLSRPMTKPLTSSSLADALAECYKNAGHWGSRRDILSLRDGLLERLWGGILSRRNFFPYQIPGLNFFRPQHEYFIGLIGVHEFFSFNFPLRAYFFGFTMC